MSFKAVSRKRQTVSKSVAFLGGLLLSHPQIEVLVRPNSAKRSPCPRANDRCQWCYPCWPNAPWNTPPERPPLNLNSSKNSGETRRNNSALKCLESGILNRTSTALKAWPGLAQLGRQCEGPIRVVKNLVEAEAFLKKPRQKPFLDSQGLLRVAAIQPLCADVLLLALICLEPLDCQTISTLQFDRFVPGHSP